MYKSVEHLINTNNSISIRTRIVKEMTTKVYYEIYRNIYISQVWDLSVVTLRLKESEYG